MENEILLEILGEIKGIKTEMGSMNSRMDKLEETVFLFKKDVDKRFDTVDKRFEEVDKRFDVVDKKFEEVDKRFDTVDKRFDVVDKKFEEVDKRFDVVDDEFAGVDKRFDVVDKKMYDSVNSIVYTIKNELVPAISGMQKDLQYVKKQVDEIKPMVLEHEFYINQLKRKEII